MKIQNTFTSGKMNKDVDERLMPDGQYRDALNVKVFNSSGSDVGAIENSLSNEAKSSIDLGLNAVCIGSVSSDALKKLFWFVVSDSGSYILEYDEYNDVTSTVLSDTREESVLNFSLSHRIISSNILIDDDNDKVFLYWTDNYNPPRRIEINSSKDLSENDFSSSDISVIKAPPSEDLSIRVFSNGLVENFMEETMFAFAYRYKYEHGEYSALSVFSEYAFSPAGVDTDLSDSIYNDAMINTANSVDIQFNSGGSDVVKVELYAIEIGNNTVYKIHELKKTSNNQNNMVYGYSFKNDKLYTALSETQFNRVYDNVPLKAKTQELIANRLIYGSYEENYDIDTTLDYSVSGNRTAINLAGTKSLKSNSSYTVGIVYYDDYGRKTSVLKADSPTYKFLTQDSETENKLVVTLNHEAPSWATRYKFAVKDDVRDYYTIRTVGPIYKNTTNVIYIKMPQEELNKLSEDRYVTVKNNGTSVSPTAYKIPFLGVETFDADHFVTGSPAGVYAKLDNTFGADIAFDWSGNTADITTVGYVVLESYVKYSSEGIYYEVPGTYNIVNGYHVGGDVDQTANTPAIVTLNAFNVVAFGDGTESNRIKDDMVNPVIQLGVRVNEEIDDYKKITRGVSLTYSDVYEQSTGYNGLNSFSLASLNYKDLDDKYGSITRIISKDSDLIVFQEDKIHKILINKNVLYTASGAGSVSQTLAVLGQEVPYLGEYGVNKSPESVQVWGNKVYFVDDRRSAACALDVNGIFEISRYGMRSWFNDNVGITNDIKCISGYDPINDHYVVSTTEDYIQWKEDTWECDTTGVVTWVEDSYSCEQA
jgi:hypothetical protein